MRVSGIFAQNPPSKEPASLEGIGVTVAFDGVRALNDVDFRLEEGQILGLIGPNGAGKTTLLHVLSGFIVPENGEVLISGRRITRWAPHRRSYLGLARTFQEGRLFERLSAFQNIEAGALGAGLPRAEARRLATNLLARFGLSAKHSRRAGWLPYGDQRRLAIARSLASRPTFLLLDEPAAGLNVGETAELVESLKDIPKDFGCGVAIVEHDMPLIMTACSRVHVLDHGKTVTVGVPEEIQSDERVIASYLG